MIKSIWIEVSDFLFKSRKVSFIDLIAFWVMFVFIGPALTASLPLWVAFLSAFFIFMIFDGISTYCLYKFTKSFRSNYTY